MTSSIRLAVLVLLFLCFAGVDATGADTSCNKSPRGIGLKHRKLTPVAFHQVEIQGGFWGRILETNRKGLIPYDLEKFQETGHVDNFAKAARLMSGRFRGQVYSDSDVYKVIEGTSYALRLHPDPQLDKHMDGIIAKIAAAQEPDGYLHTYFILHDPKNKWKDPGRNELYCAGHLLEAGVGHYEATGKRTLLEVAVRLANHLHANFGPESDKSRVPPEHQEVELGLLRLYGSTGDQRYLDLARFFLEQRGHAAGRRCYGSYAQDHAPVAQQEQAVGHAVRATYMYSAMADVVAYTGEPAYRNALEKLWKDVVFRKMFITGGVGLLVRGNSYESFADPYYLPNDQPDVDTCTVIGHIFWLHRMNCLEPDGRFGDVIERILYNRLLAGISLDGTRFFYGCPLSCRGPEAFNRGPDPQCDSRHARPTWFGCVCCPTNLPRILSTIGGYAYATSDRAIYVNQYIGGKATVAVKELKITLQVQTRYPWEGDIRICVEPEEPAVFALKLRIPGWARGCEHPGGLYRTAGPYGEVALKLNSQPVEDFNLNRGFAGIRRRWQKGDFVTLQLPMGIRRIKAHPRIQADVGRVALMRGPIVYCIEGVDNGGRVFHISLPPEAEFSAEHRAGLLDGVTVIKGMALARREAKKGDRREVEPKVKPVTFVAIPFYAWDNRTPGPMTVWIPETPDLAEPGG